jgi:4-amino-4-deoxy-L-arabinose transferase-like glycosyltransferase
MKHKLTGVLLLLIILIAAYLRFDGIFKGLFAFTYDVGRDMLAVSSILTTHKISLIGFTTGLPGVFYGPWWYLMLLPLFVISGGNPQGVALCMAIIGILTVFLAYLFGKKLGGTFLGLTFASLVSVSPFLISLSVQIWNPNVAPLFIFFVLFVLYKVYAQEKIKLWYFFALGFLLALIIDLEIVFGLMFFMGIVLSVLLMAYKKISLKAILAFALGVLVIFSPRIIFEFRHQFLMTKAFISFLTTGDASQKLSLVDSFINRASIVFNQFNQTVALENAVLGFLIIVFTLVMLAAFYKKADSIIRKFIGTSLVVIFVFLVGLTFFKHDIWPHYLVGLPVFYILLVSMAAGLLRQKMNNYLLPALIVLVIFLINLNPASIINNLTKPVWVGDASVYKNQLQVIDYVYNQSKGKDFKYVVYTPAVYDYPYQYLFQWYGPHKYHYAPSVDSRTAYFILEPDTQYPFRLTDWLKQREKDGKIIKTEKFESGIIVQTRTH